MKKKDQDRLVDRRKFLKSAAVGGIATFAATSAGAAAAAAIPQAPTPPAKMAAMPKEADPNVEVSNLTVDRSGSDFMVDVIKALGFEYVAANPGSSFRGLHESLINYGGNKAPEFITCCHEESSVGIAHGYANVEGKPILVLAHSTVGLQHASMGIYNAWAGRAPIYIMLGNTIDETMRRPGVEWYHSALDAAAMVREFTKWDDTPISLPHFAESAVRAYKISMTLPMEPVVLVIDSDLQEKAAPNDPSLRIPRLTLDAHPQGDSGAINEAAKMLVAAENPVIVAGRVARTEEGMQRLIAFAEALQVPVIDQGGNLPSHHPLNSPGAAQLRNADVILGLEVENFWGMLHTYRDQQERSYSANTKAGAKLIHVGVNDTYLKSNYQTFQRYQEFDLSIAGDPETTLPSLTEAVKRLASANQKSQYQDRGKRLADAAQKAHERAKVEATYGWNSSPISLPRLSAEVWAQVKNEDWAGGVEGVSWNYDKFYQRLRGGSAAGEGGGAPTAVGAALAHRKYGRLYVHLQKDGDLMYAPGVLWTAAHNKIPMLMVMHNNRAYHQEVMHIQRMSNRHQRSIMDTAGIGTTLVDPNIDYAKLAQSMGWYAEGPITNPNDIGSAVGRAIAAVKRGEPALLDTVTQPR
jgi:acetolactate synthase I/II/III large subunit